jgi:hypothetical protein
MLVSRCKLRAGNDFQDFSLAELGLCVKSNTAQEPNTHGACCHLLPEQNNVFSVQITIRAVKITIVKLTRCLYSWNLNSHRRRGRAGGSEKEVKKRTLFLVTGLVTQSILKGGKNISRRGDKKFIQNLSRKPQNRIRFEDSEVNAG